MLCRRASFIAALAIAVVALGRLDAQDLTDADYARWRDYVLPTPKELAYRSIAWRPSFWEAVIEAQEKEKPILLWAMNGHALCNT